MTPKPKLSLKFLKEKYPRPLRAIDGCSIDDHYCVGGALCREAGMQDKSFPNDTEIMDALYRVNPHIERYELNDRDYVNLMGQIKSLTKANDAGDFDLAWHILGDLLKRRSGGSAS